MEPQLVYHCIAPVISAELQQITPAIIWPNLAKQNKDFKKNLNEKPFEDSGIGSLSLDSLRNCSRLSKRSPKVICNYFGLFQDPQIGRVRNAQVVHLDLPYL